MQIKRIFSVVRFPLFLVCTAALLLISSWNPVVFMWKAQQSVKFSITEKNITITEKIDPSVCILVRTASLQKGGHFSLPTMLESLKNLNNPHWKAFVFVTDRTPFPELQQIVNDTKDERIQYFENPARIPWNLWEAGYAGTDYAIYNACPEDFEWLLITNGDNYYLNTFLDHLDSSVDLVGTDFFSRYYKRRDTFVVRPASPNRCANETVGCFQNRLQHTRTDLGANVLKLQKFRSEKHQYSAFWDDQDGRMIQYLTTKAGWTSKLVEECLFSHSPNWWQCCMEGGEWIEKEWGKWRCNFG